eukprot:208231_1
MSILLILYVIYKLTSSVQAHDQHETQASNATQSVMDELIELHDSLNPQTRNKIEDLFVKMAEEGINILDEPAESGCIDLLETTGLIELIYIEMEKMDSTPQTNADIKMNKMIQFVGTDLCKKEAESFENAKIKFYTLSEHKQNEIVDTILQRGVERNAWDASLYSECIDLMKIEINDLYSVLHQQYPQLIKLKKLLTSIVLDTCASYFSDKRDL